MIRWSWRREAKTPEPRRTASIRHLELEAAKEILKEVFNARPSDVEDMIQSRLEEKHWNETDGAKKKVYGRKSSAWVIRWDEALRA